jgi:glycosyltransferase involved in cell wall biosynthesis
MRHYGKRLPVIFLALIAPSVFLWLYKQLPRRLSKKMTPYARYCRSRLLRQDNIEILYNKPHNGKVVDVSIIIPNFNYARFISTAIHSAEEAAKHAQDSGISTEIIIVDDGSQDSSRETIQREINSLLTPSIAFFVPLNCGLSKARNIGIEASKGKFVLLLDSDNWLTNNAVIDLFKAIEHTNAAAVFGKIQTRNVETNQQGMVFSKEPYDLERLLNRGNYIDAMAMYRQRTLESLGGFSEKLQLFSWCYEDYEMWVRLGSSGHSVLNINEFIGEYLVKGDSLIMQAVGEKQGVFRLIQYQGKARLFIRNLLRKSS